MGTLFVDKLDPQSGTSLEIGSSGDTISVPSGATFDVPSGATLDVTGATVSGLTIGDNKPIFYAHNQNSQTIANNTFTVVQFDTDSAANDFDPDGKFNTSNYRFTPGVSGFYLLYTQIAMYDNGDFDNFRCTIRKNGGAIVRGRMPHRDNGAITCMTVVSSDTDDYFDCEVYHDKGSNTSLTTGFENTFFTGFKLNT